MPLATFRILLVEDEMLVAMAIEDILAEAKCTVVGPVATLRGAMELVACDDAIDAAVVDLNLDRESAMPLVDALAERQIPIVVCTGYGSAPLPPPHQDVPVLGKPYGLTDLVQKLLQLLDPAARGRGRPTAAVHGRSDTGNGG